jgi:hypothetical protein
MNKIANLVIYGNDYKEYHNNRILNKYEIYDDGPYEYNLYNDRHNYIEVCKILKNKNWLSMTALKEFSKSFFELEKLKKDDITSNRGQYINELNELKNREKKNSKIKSMY